MATLGYPSTYHCKVAILYEGRARFFCSNHNLFGALIRGPLGVRLSLHKQSDHQVEKFDWLAEKWPRTGMLFLKN
jgi:hypothetical protein